MNYTKQVSRFFVLILLISMSGCIKNGDFDFNKMKDIEWNPKLAIPLVSSELSITDMLKPNGSSSNALIDDKGFVTLVYKDRLFSVTPAGLISVPPITFSTSHTFTAVEAATINSAGSLTFSIPMDVKLTSADSIRIDSLIYTKGDLTLTITGNVTNNGSVALSIPEARKSGLPLNATFTPLANGTKTIDLSGYKYDLTKVTGKLSTFRINASITITNTPAGSITAGKVINFNFVQHTDKIKVLSGYFGRFILFNDKKTVNLNIFNNAFAQGQFSLVDPYLKFTFTNSAGLPVLLRVVELRGINAITGKSFNLAGTQGISMNINSPAYTSTLPSISTFTINNSTYNGAINNLLNIKPSSMAYNFNGLTNPGVVKTENFLRDISNLDVDVELGLPLYGYAKNFAVQDTFDFKFDNIEDVENMLLRTIIDNEFPLEAKMQVYFTDASYKRLDSLVTGDPVIIPAAQVNLATGVLISSTKKTSDFNYPKSRMNKITGSRKILVKALLNTSGSATQNIKIYNTYKLKVKLAVQAEIKKKI